MKRPRVRFTVRRLMAVVLASGVLLGVAVGLSRRAERFRRIALDHARQAQTAADIAWSHQRLGLNPDGSVPQEDAREAARLWRLRAHHRAMQDKYERAARSPWLPVRSDPPK